MKTTMLPCKLAIVLVGLFLRGGTAAAASPSSCGSWSIIASPDAGLYDELDGVTAISANDVWAVGYITELNGVNTQTLIEHWDGSQWKIVSSPNPGSERDQLYGVAAISANDVWAVGDSFNGGNSNNLTLIEHWDGTQWSVVSSANIGNGKSIFSGVAALSANNIWAVGFKRNSKTLIEHWDGTQWKSTPSAKVTGGLFGIVALSTNNAWAIGAVVPSKRVFQTVIEHWDGSNWSVVPSPGAGSYSRLNGIAAVPGTNNLWAVGLHEKGNQGTLIEFYC